MNKKLSMKPIKPTNDEGLVPEIKWLPAVASRPKHVDKQPVSQIIRKALRADHSNSEIREFPPEENLLKGVVIEISKSSREERKQTMLYSPTGKSKWPLLRSVIKAVQLFRVSEVDTINDEKDLVKALSIYQSS